MERINIGAFLDKLGINLGAIYLLYGKPRVGKTAFAFSFASNHVREGKRVLMIYSRPRFPVERITRALTADELSFINVCTPKTIEEQTSVISRIAFLYKQKPISVIVDEITDLYTLSLSAGGFSTGSVREAAYEINKQLGFLSDFAKTYNATCLVTCEERGGSELAIPLQRMLFYWSEKVFRMSVDEQGRLLLRVIKPDEKLEFECKIAGGLITDIELRKRGL